MDKLPNPPAVPPGFTGRTHKSLLMNNTSVFIPDGHAEKIIPHRAVYNQRPVIAASAPAETLPYVDILLKSSTERRSLSPCRKTDGTQLTRARVLSCSDLESVLTAKTQNSPRLNHDYQRPATDFHDLPPIQSGPSSCYVPINIQRMMMGHNVQPLILGHRLSGQQISRMMQAPVRPPPGFNIPVVTHSISFPPSPHYGSPQPWSPARLAPMFYRDEISKDGVVGVESKIKSETSGNGETCSRSLEVSSCQDGRAVAGNVGAARTEWAAMCSGYSKEELPKPSLSSHLNKVDHIDPWEMALKAAENIWLSEKKTVDDHPDTQINFAKKKEKKKKQKKEKKQIETNAENVHVSITAEHFPHNTVTGSENKSDALDNGQRKNQLIEPISPCNNKNEESTAIEKEEERIRKLKKKLKKQKKVEKFENYWTLDQINNGLADKTLIEAEIRINHRNYKEAYVTVPENGQDIIILGLRDRNRSLDGDIVVVKIKDELELQRKEKLKQGKVVYIKEQVHHRCTVGTLHVIDKGMVMLVPRDQRFPLLRIRHQSIPLNLLENLSTTNLKSVMFKAAIMSWDITRYAYGTIKKKVGKKGELESETSAIFEELGLNPQPVPDLKQYLPPLPYQIPEQEISRRLDLRSEVIFTIDPPTARDLDDAVSIKKLSDDTYEVGVHISDVSFFLQEGTRLDRIVSERATTVYMVEDVFHMLPITLCGLCSLNPGEDKLAISVIMKIHKNGILSQRIFKRSVIHSCAQLSYDEAQDVIDRRDIEFPEIHNNVQSCHIKQAILQLHELAANFRKKRFDQGALRIDQPKLSFTLDGDSMPNGLSVYTIKDSHRLIEEFMLLANESVARFIHEKAPDIALLRRHDPPKWDMMDKLVRSLNDIGIILDPSSAGNLHTSLSNYCDEDETKAHVLYHLCSRPMKRAMYFCASDETHHFALNMEKYTHFTSPIRRYADIVVHRILSGCLDLSPMPPWDAEQVSRFASVCNKKKYTAKRANEMSCDLFRTLYVKKIGSLTVDAIVVSVSAHSLNVIIPSLAFNTKVSLERMDGIEFEFVDNEMHSTIRIKWPEVETIQDIKVFSCIQVLLICGMSKNLSPQIQSILLPPPHYPS